MKITQYPEAASLNDGDVVLIDGPTGTHTFKAKNIGAQAISSSWTTLLNKFYPVGSVYLSFDSVSPAVKFGGTWVQITEQFLRAANNTGTGGTDTVTLTANQSGLRDHSHKIVLTSSGGSGKASMPNPVACAAIQTVSGYIETQQKMDAGQAHSNMPSYQNVFAWHRIA